MKIGKMQDQCSHSYLLTLKKSNIIKKYPYLLRQLHQVEKYKFEFNEDKYVKLELIAIFDNLRSQQSTLGKNAKIQFKLQSLKVISKKVKQLEKCISILKIKSPQLNKFNLKVKSQSNSQILNQQTLSSGGLILQNLIDKYHNIIVILKNYRKKVTFTKFINEFIDQKKNSQFNDQSLQNQLKKLVSHIFKDAQSTIKQMMSFDSQQKGESKNNLFAIKQKFKDYFQLKDFQIYIQLDQSLDTYQFPSNFNELNVIVNWNPSEVNSQENQEEIPQLIQKYIVNLTIPYSGESKVSSLSTILWNSLNLFKKINLIRLLKRSILKNMSSDNDFLNQLIAQVLKNSQGNIQQQQILKNRINKFKEQSKIKSEFQLQNLIEEEQKQQFIPKKLRIKSNIKITLNSQQSQNLLDQYYRKYYSSIFSYLSVQRQMYFKLTNPQRDKNFKQMGFSHIKWVSLKYIQEPVIQITKSSYQNYLSFLLSSYFENTLLYLRAQMSCKSIQNEEQNQIEEFSYFYNQKQNCLLLNRKESNKFIDLQHLRYNLKLLNNSFRIFSQQKLFILNQQTINLLIRRSRSLTQQKKQKNENFQLRQLVSIPVRGKYCNHVDFFDLSQIYNNQIKKQFQCPKCCQYIQLQELIYLEQMQILLQMLRLFYLKKVDGPKIKKCSEYKNYSENQQLFQQTLSILKELKLIVNHDEQTVKVKGFYQNFQFDNKTSSYQQRKLQQFQFILNQCYLTFCNPQKKYKNQAKKINKFLQSYGLSPFLQKIKEEKQLKHCMEQSIYDMNYLTKLLTFQQKIELTYKYLQKKWSLGGEQTSQTIQQSLR